MGSLLRRTAALLAGLSLAASAREAAAQVVPQPAPLQVAVSPPAPTVTPRREAVDGGTVGLAVGLAAAGILDVSFGVYDAVQARRGQALPIGVAVAQGVLVGPQAVGLDTLHAMMAASAPEGSTDEKALAPLVLLPGVTNALFFDAALNGAPRSVPPVTLLGASWALGFDTAFSASAIAAAVNGRWFPRALGAVEMALTAPQIAAASYGIARDRQHLADWAPLTAWSSALFVHGLVSTALPRSAPPAPSAPVEPPKPRLLVPASIEVGPANIARGSGLSVSGRFF
jgi:hypothetical protein